MQVERARHSEWVRVHVRARTWFKTPNVLRHMWMYFTGLRNGKGGRIRVQCSAVVILQQFAEAVIVIGPLALSSRA